MSLEIDGLGPLVSYAVSRSATVQPGRARAAAPGAAAATDAPADAVAQDAVEVKIADAIPPAPPRELGTAFATAAQAYDQLAALGRHIHFTAGAGTASLQIEVQDLDGNTLGAISAADVLRLASGEGFN